MISSCEVHGRARSTFTSSPSARSQPGGGWRNSDGFASFQLRGISSYAPRDAFTVHICHAVPIDALVFSFHIEQCAVVPCYDCSSHMSGTCQPIKVKFRGRDDLSQYDDAALRWAHGAHEFLDERLSCLNKHQKKLLHPGSLLRSSTARPPTANSTAPRW
jgi:hypothetical protein